MTLRKLLLILSGTLAIVGSFLPWYKVSLFGYSQSANAFQMTALYIVLAILTIVCGAVVIILSAMKEKQIKKMVKIKNASKITMFVGIAMAIIAAIAFIALKSESQGFGNVSWGIWFMLIAAAATICLPVLKAEQLEKVVLGEAEKKEEKKDAKKPATKKSEKKD